MCFPTLICFVSFPRTFSLFVRFSSPCTLLFTSPLLIFAPSFHRRQLGKYCAHMLSDYLAVVALRSDDSGGFASAAPFSAPGLDREASDGRPLLAGGGGGGADAVRLPAPQLTAVGPARNPLEDVGLPSPLPPSAATAAATAASVAADAVAASVARQGHAASSTASGAGGGLGLMPSAAAALQPGAFALLAAMSHFETQVGGLLMACSSLPARPVCCLYVAIQVI